MRVDDRLRLRVEQTAGVRREVLLLAALLTAVGSAGYGASLLQQEQLVALTPVDVRGQALGVEGSARMSAQGLCAVLAGTLADVVGADVAIAVLAAASLAVTAALVPALRRAEAAAHGPRAVSWPQARAGRTQKSLPDGSA